MHYSSLAFMMHGEAALVVLHILCEQVADLGRFCLMGLAMGIVDGSNGGGKGKAETLFHGIYCKVHCPTRAIASFHFGV